MTSAGNYAVLGVEGRRLAVRVNSNSALLSLGYGYDAGCQLAYEIGGNADTLSILKLVDFLGVDRPPVYIDEDRAGDRGRDACYR